MTRFTHTDSRGNERLVTVADIHGICTPGEIVITERSRRGSREELDTVVHEWLHAEFPMLTEKRVEEVAASGARFLWAMGYRRKGKRG